MCTKAAERDYQRNRYRRQRGRPVDPRDPLKLNMVESQLISSHDGSVVTAVRAALAASLDDPQHVAVQPAAARQLVEILGALSKRTQRRREARGRQVDDGEFTIVLGDVT
jgi:hypothetical protein